MTKDRLPTTIEPFLSTVSEWKVHDTPQTAKTLVRELIALKTVLERRLDDFDVTVRRPCGFFRGVPEHLAADDSRTDEVFERIELIKHGWVSWLAGFHRFAQRASIRAAADVDKYLDTTHYHELLRERHYVEQEGLELRNRTIEEIHDIEKKIGFLKDDPDSVRNAEEDIENFERRREILKKELEEQDPAKEAKRRIVDYLASLPDTMRELEAGVDAVHDQLIEAVRSIDTILPIIDGRSPRVAKTLDDLVRFLAPNA